MQVQTQLLVPTHSGLTEIPAQMMPGFLTSPQKRISRQAGVRQGWGLLRETLIVLITCAEERRALWERRAHTRCRRGLLKREPYLSDIRVAMCAVSVASAAASQGPFLPPLSGE